MSNPDQPQKPFEMIEVKMKPSPEKNNFFCGGNSFSSHQYEKCEKKTGLLEK